MGLAGSAGGETGSLETLGIGSGGASIVAMMLTMKTTTEDSRKDVWGRMERWSRESS
jgi:hypothetical protein